MKTEKSKFSGKVKDLHNSSSRNRGEGEDGYLFAKALGKKWSKHIPSSFH